jgi:hypothetical protein
MYLLKRHKPTWFLCAEMKRPTRISSSLPSNFFATELLHDQNIALSKPEQVIEITLSSPFIESSCPDA